MASLMNIILAPSYTEKIYQYNYRLCCVMEIQKFDWLISETK